MTSATLVPSYAGNLGRARKCLRTITVLWRPPLHKNGEATADAGTPDGDMVSLTWGLLEFHLRQLLFIHELIAQIDSSFRW